MVLHSITEYIKIFETALFPCSWQNASPTTSPGTPKSSRPPAIEEGGFQDGIRP